MGNAPQRPMASAVGFEARVTSSNLYYLHRFHRSHARHRQEDSRRPMEGTPLARTRAPHRSATGRARAHAAAAPKADILRISLSVLIVLSVSHIHQRFGVVATLRPGLLLTIAALGSAFLDRSVLAG